VSHTAEAHTTPPALSVHAPVSAGSWPAIVGSAWRSAASPCIRGATYRRTGPTAVAVDRAAVVWMHTPGGEQAPPRHTLLVAHDLPSGRPHLLSLSQMPELHSSALAQVCEFGSSACTRRSRNSRWRAGRTATAAVGAVAAAAAARSRWQRRLSQFE